MSSVWLILCLELVACANRFMVLGRFFAEALEAIKYEDVVLREALPLHFSGASRAKSCEKLLWIVWHQVYCHKLYI